LFQDKKKGARTDLYAIYDKIKEGATVQEIMDLDFALWARNHRAISNGYFKRGFSRAMRAIAAGCYLALRPPEREKRGMYMININGMKYMLTIQMTGKDIPSNE